MKLTELLNHDIKCSCGRTHRCDIENVIIEQGALSRLFSALSEKGSVALVADSNTFAVCGEQVADILGDKVTSTCIFETEGHLVPNEEAVKKIEDTLRDDTDFILGVGSGVINDICKYVAFERGIRSGIVATATSMDGFASSGAAMIFDGMKITYTVNAPALILGDTDILKEAPMDMIASGYADIIGKYSALCDWKLASLVENEPFCPYIYGIVKDSTDEVRSLAKKLTERDGEAVGRLMEILVLVGACLTLNNSTRPGSGSEHHLSHYFEITGLVNGEPYFLHGTDVGYATVVTARLREALVGCKSPVFRAVSDIHREEAYRKIYGRVADEVIALQKSAGRYENVPYDFYTANWEKILEILKECPTSEEITEMLLSVGFDMTLFEKMYGREKIENGILYGKDLKDRYSVLWIYYFLEGVEKYEK